jgi:putative DNA primase/helicase
MPYDLSDFDKYAVPKSTADVGDIDLSGGISRLNTLPADIRDSLATVGNPAKQNRSRVDDGIMRDLLRRMTPADARATFLASKRGQDAVTRKNSHWSDYIDRTVKHALSVVKKEGSGVKKKKTREKEASALELVEVDLGDAKNSHCTDVGNSERLADAFGNDMRYCAEQKVWYCWDGRRWEKNDPTGRIMSFAKKVARSILGEAQKEPDDALRARLSKWAISSESRVRLDAMIALCRDLSPIRLEKFESFDHDLHLLNFHNGTLDLRTAKIRDHRRGDLITKILKYDYRPEAKCERFLQFVDEAIGKDNIACLQKCLGYSLTGDTREKKLLLCCGPKNRGKTTLLELVVDLLGDLCARLDIESLLCSERFQNSTNVKADLADLAGARFVISSEPERRAKLSSTRIKNLTKGEGRLRAIRKYENWIEFRETYKIWLDMNSLPSVEDDEATWARLVPIPFQPAKELDRELPAKLRKEAEGILAWIVEGARLWYAEGLELPQKWESTRSTWRKHENKFQQFVNECCVLDGKSRTSAHALLKAQHEWAQKNNAVYFTDKTLADELGKLRLTKCRSHGGTRCWQGIALSY